MPVKPTLSKSRYLSGDQCHLRLWYDSYERDLAPPPDASLQTVFDTGHEVGRLACERHPGGHYVEHDHRHVREALEETRRVIEAGTASIMFEPSFRHEGVLVRVDILERLAGGGWRLGEVKSTTRLKDVNIPDVAVQLWVLRGVGLDVREAEVVTLNRDYVHDGIRLAEWRCHLLEIGRYQAARHLRLLPISARKEASVPNPGCYPDAKCEQRSTARAQRFTGSPAWPIRRLIRLALPADSRLRAARPNRPKPSWRSWANPSINW